MRIYKDLRSMLEAAKSGEIPPNMAMTGPEACEVLAVSRTRLDQLLATGAVDGWRAGRFVIIDRSTVKAYAARAK